MLVRDRQPEEQHIRGSRLVNRRLQGEQHLTGRLPATITLLRLVNQILLIRFLQKEHYYTLLYTFITSIFVLFHVCYQ